MLIPGFLTGDGSLRAFESWLRRCGHRTHASGMRVNADCSEASMGRLEQRLQAFVETQGEPAVVIGQSRGGCFAACWASGGPTWCARWSPSALRTARRWRCIH